MNMYNTCITKKILNGLPVGIAFRLSLLKNYECKCTHVDIFLSYTNRRKGLPEKYGLVGCCRNKNLVQEIKVKHKVNLTNFLHCFSQILRGGKMCSLRQTPHLHDLCSNKCAPVLSSSLQIAHSLPPRIITT